MKVKKSIKIARGILLASFSFTNALGQNTPGSLCKRFIVLETFKAKPDQTGFDNM